jgi:hypothetical protein
MRRLVLVLALVFVPSAAAVGPWLGTIDGGSGVADTAANVSYVTKVRGATTTVTALRRSDHRVVASTTVAGRWGIPTVTLNGAAGGLSPNDRVLVLAERLDPTGELRTRSSFTVLATEPLAVRNTIHLKGDFGFDALSPNGRTLYLIQHVSQTDLSSYRVRGYDLAAGRLLAGVIADKRQAGWTMSGYPVARATTGGGRWVYTLYQQGNNYPFVHALDAANRTAVCIGLPWNWTGLAADDIMNARLTLAGGKLVIAGNHGAGTRFALDTRTFEVTKL